MEEKSNEKSENMNENTIAPKVRWSTNNLNSSYANVCNVTSTHEEMVLNFGINQTWDRSAQEVEIQLTNRIILSPFTAKRLMVLLSRLIHEYESRYDEIKLDVPNEGSPARQ